MGMNHVIREQLRVGQGYVRIGTIGKPAGARPGRSSTCPQNFKPLFHREIPILVHTQGYQVINRHCILHDEFKLKVIIGHACFDSFRLARRR